MSSETEIAVSIPATLDRLRQAEVKIENLRKAVSGQAAIIDAQSMLLGEVLKALKEGADDVEKTS